MGYSYAKVGRHTYLCCDACGIHGQVRRYKCPFGYCQAVALCPDCHKNHPEYTSAEAHRTLGCEAISLRIKAQEQRRQELLAAGQSVRCSAANWSKEALSIPNGVHVLFRDACQHVTAYVMSADTYHAIAILEPATIDDFRQHGPVVAVESVDFWA